VSRRWSDARLLTKSLLIVGVPVVALIVTVALSLALQGQESRYRALAIATSTDLTASRQAVQSFYEADSSIRGSAASGDAASLRKFDSLLPQLVAWVRSEADDQFAPDRPTVAAVVADGNREITVLDSLRSDVVGPSGGAGGAAGTDSAAGTDNGVSVLIVRDDATMQRLQNDLGRLVSEETALSLSQRSEIVDSQRLSEWFLIAGLIVGVLGGVLGTVLLSRSIVRRVKLVGVNAQRFLASQPLEDIADSRDEIGQLSDVIITAGSLLADRNQEIAVARDDALAANQAKDEFLSRMSHELRTPLTAILGFGQLLQLEDLAGEDRESVDHIVRAGEHLLALINEVLDITQVTQGRLDLLFETVDVAAAVGEAVALMTPIAAERGIAIEVVQADPGLAAFADRQRVQQILLNLLSNAVKYNRPAGSITVRVRLNDRSADDINESDGVGDGVVIAVADTGQGIDESQLERVFTPFDRLSAAQSTVEGTGVGLPLSRALAEAMGGTLTFNSTVGVGSTFTVGLVRDAKAEELDQRVGSGPETDGSGPADVDRTILYVENDLSDLRVIERVLRHRPERLHVAVQGQMCLTLARQLVPSLILLELHLPDLRGEEVLHRLQLDPLTAGVPVVVFGNGIAPGRAEYLIRTGATEVLTKPLDIRRLIALLDRVAAG